MYLKGTEDSIAGGPERLDYGVVFIHWQIPAAGGRNKPAKKVLKDSLTKYFYRHPHSNSSPDSPTKWAITNDSEEDWSVYDDYRVRWDFVGDAPRPTEFYAEPSFMRAPGSANYPTPRFKPRKAVAVITTRVVPTPVPVNPVSAELVEWAPVKPIVLANTQIPPLEHNFQPQPLLPSNPPQWRPVPLVSRNPLGTNIRHKLKLLPRSKPTAVAAPATNTSV